MTLLELEMLIANASDAERQEIFQLLRKKYGLKIHPLEQRWNTSAEALLDAIDQAGDLTQRGIRGVLAEATFRKSVVPEQMAGWRQLPVTGDQPYDLLLADAIGEVKVQVKLQRREKGIPKHYRNNKDLYAVETQRTRSGKRTDQAASRPYRVGEFDVLAVCLQPSTGEWTTFVYSAVRDLHVRPDEPHLLAVMQPFPVAGSDIWTRNFDAAVARLRAPT